MSGLSWTVVVIAAALGALAAAVRLGDRTLFVPPPDAAAESFVRQITTRRYDRARALLSGTTRSVTTVEELRALAAELERRVGAIERVEAECLGMSGDSASAAARAIGPRPAEATVEVTLVREHGLWRVSNWKTGP